MIKRGGSNINNEEETNEEFNLRMEKCKEKRNREIQRFISNRITKEKSEGKNRSVEALKFIDEKINKLKKKIRILDTPQKRLSNNEKKELSKAKQQYLNIIRSENEKVKIKQEYYEKKEKENIEAFKKALLGKYIDDYKKYNMGDGNNNNLINPNKFTYNRHVPQCHSLFNPYGSEPNNKVNNAKVNNAKVNNTRVNNAKVNDPKQNKQPSFVGSLFGKTGGNSKKRSSKKIPVKKPSSKKAPLKKRSSKK
jgi:hypothetical protein